jgi:hypothetical protein
VLSQAGHLVLPPYAATLYSARTLHVFARGGGTYAELNLEAGTANYIEPLLLSVQQV